MPKSSDLSVFFLEPWDGQRWYTQVYVEYVSFQQKEAHGRTVFTMFDISQKAHEWLAGIKLSILLKQRFLKTQELEIWFGASYYNPLSNDKSKTTIICFLLWLNRIWQIIYCPGVYFPTFVHMLRVHPNSHSSPRLGSQTQSSCHHERQVTYWSLLIFVWLLWF